MVVGYMVRDMNQSFLVAFSILTAGTVPAILSTRYCRAMGAVVAVGRPMTSLSLLDFWLSSCLPSDQGGSYMLGSITKLCCSYYTTAIAGRELNSPLLSAEQLSVRLKINLKPMPFPPPHTQHIFTYTKTPKPWLKIPPPPCIRSGPWKTISHFSEL